MKLGMLLMVSLSLGMAAKTSWFWWRENSKNQWFADSIASATACVNKEWTLVIRFGALTSSRVHEAFVSAFLAMCSQLLYPGQTSALSLSLLSFLSGRCFQVRCSAKLAALPRTVHQRVVLRVIVRKILLTHFNLCLFFQGWSAISLVTATSLLATCSCIGVTLEVKVTRQYK